MLKIYGIKNCGSVKKGLLFLEDLGEEFEFIDYKKVAPSKELVERFVEKFGVDKVLNRRGTTFRKLSDEDKVKCGDEGGAVKLMVENSSLIKRPVVVGDGVELIGFDEGEWDGALGG